MYTNGETSERIVPLCSEGLERARRSMDHSSTSWIAQNMANRLTFEGRPGEALAYAEEAIANARAVGDQGRLANCIIERAFVRLATRDREGARADIVESHRAMSRVEPQDALFDTLFDALFLWPDDPQAACRSLSEALHSTGVALPSLLDAAPLAARMALRIGDSSSLRNSVGVFLDVAARCSGPVRVLQGRWMDALRSDLALGAASLRAVAGEFEVIGYRLPGADCHADAAVLAERAGLDAAPDLDAAHRLYAACGAVPLLQEIRQPA